MADISTPLERPTRECDPASSIAKPILCAHSWLHEASNPYWDWLWGSAAEGQVQLQLWMRRPSSELSLQRIVSLKEGDSVIGGYIALSGVQVQLCRKADLIAIVNRLRCDPSNCIMARLREAQHLFHPPRETEFYLSRMGLVYSAQGHKIGSQLVQSFLKEGQLQGFRHFRLDVSADNERAIRLYRKLGFVVDRESVTVGSAIRYYSMMMSLSAERSE